MAKLLLLAVAVVLVLADHKEHHHKECKRCIDTVTVIRSTAKAMSVIRAPRHKIRKELKRVADPICKLESEALGFKEELCRKVHRAIEHAKNFEDWANAKAICVDFDFCPKQGKKGKKQQQGFLEKYESYLKTKKYWERKGECFPGKASVITQNRGEIQIADLEIGDRVRSIDEQGKTVFSDVYIFTHADKTSVSDFVNLHFASGKLQLSSGHYVPTYPQAGKGNKLYKKAEDVVVGDFIMHVGASSATKVRVDAVSTTVEQGVYNPHTRNNHIVVNGVAASVYSDWVLEGLTSDANFIVSAYKAMFAPVIVVADVLSFFGFHEPAATHMGLNNPGPVDVGRATVSYFAVVSSLVAFPVAAAVAFSRMCMYKA